MSLQVWLPLNGDLHNQGLKQYNLTMFRGTETYNNNGKIGKCFYSNGTNTIKIMNIIPDVYNYSGYSFCAWFYIEAQNKSHTCSAIISAGNWNNQVLNLSVGGWETDHYKYLYVSATSWDYKYQYNFQKNTWYHVVVSSDGIRTRAYVNGILLGDTLAGFLPSSIEGNDICIGGATYFSKMQFYGRINDVRIYNHCLSPKEVEEISKGLVLHYKLDNYWLAENLLINTHFDNRLSQTIGWDTSKNGTLAANYWGGYNSGVANQATVYHAHLKEVNGEYVYEFIKDENNQWLGISQSGIQSKLTAGTKYTFSWEQYCVSGSNYVNTGLYYYKTGASSAGFHLGYGYGSSGRVIGQWQKFTYTFTAPSDADYTKNMSWYVYGAQGGNGTFYARHFKLEKGDKATPWCPAKSDTLYTTLGYNSATIYDSSGYSNNGTIIGSLGAAAPSPRYDVATQFPGNALIEAEPLPAETKTISAWIKWNSIPSGTGASSYTMPLHDKNSGLAIGVYNGGTALISYVGTAAGGAGSNVSCSITTNTWYHIVVVKTGDTTRDVYINNVKQSPITNNYWGGNMAKFHIGGRHLGGSYSAYLNGQIVDVRAYATALSAQQIKELYNTSMQIDSSGNVFARELVEL